MFIAMKRRKQNGLFRRGYPNDMFHFGTIENFINFVKNKFNLILNSTQTFI